MPTVQLHITLKKPPPGVLFSLQDRARTLSQQTLSTGADITFHVEIERDAAGRVHGKFAMGPPAQRFLYICSGTLAGQAGSPWTRRAKIPLMNLPNGRELGCELSGSDPCDAPVCATVRLLHGGWAAPND